MDYSISSAVRAPAATLAPRWTVAKVGSAVLALVCLFYLLNDWYERQFAAIQTPNATQDQANAQSAVVVDDLIESQGLPVRLKIPRMDVDAAVQYVGVTADGAMAVPNNIVDVGWFDLGPRPGEIGSAVIAGHFNGQKGEAGVFTNLRQVQTGDIVYVEDEQGVSTAFVVRENRIYTAGYADAVFSQHDRAHLNLVTCDGVWDTTTHSYTKRLVVFADKIP